MTPFSTTAVPEWRASAKAGIPLSQIKPTAKPVEIQAKKPAASQPSLLNAQLSRIIRPEAASRWLLPSSKNVTPEYVETVLRGALTGSHVLQWELFDLMEDTWPRLTKNLNELKRAVISRDWKVEAWAEEDTAPTSSAEEKAKLVSRAVWTMKPAADEDANGFERTIYDILDAWAKGISVLELEWETRSSGNLGDFVAPKASYWVHPQNYGYSDEGWLGLNLSGANARGIYATRATIERFPDDKFLVATCKARSGHPLAGALLRPLAFWWCAANFSASWFLNFAQLFGLPIRWANYDPNVPGLLEKVLDMLENMGSAAYAAFPAGTNLDIKEPMKAGTDNPQVALLDRADTQCDILILGQTLTTDTPTAGGGTRAQGEVHLSVRADVIQAAADFVAGVINTQLVPMILRLNYPDDSEAPEFCPEEKRIEDAKANAERDQILLGQGVQLPKAWFYERHNIPLPRAGEETISGRMPGSAGVSPAEDAAGTAAVPGAAPMQARRSAQEKLVDNVLEDLTGVEARWLGGLKPIFHYLIATAQSDRVSDEQFEQVLIRARNAMPELFDHLDKNALATALENAMATSLVNGAVRGALERGGPARAASRGGAR